MVRNEVVDALNRIILDEDTAAVIRIIRSPGDLAIEDVAQSSKEMLNQEYQPQTQSMSAFKLVRKDQISALREIERTGVRW